MKPLLARTCALAALATAAGAAPACLAEGEPIQWIADYCMLKLQTDDEIAASGCIDEELKRSFATECGGNLHFKTRMCEIVVRAGTRSGTVGECVKDPAFKGRTVASQGVGG